MAQDKCRIFVDADACPVKEEIVKIAERFAVDVHFIASYAHAVQNPPGGTWTYVDSRKEEVDMAIVNRVEQHDIVVTQDTGLASLLVSREVYVLSPRGKQYRESNIETALFSRYMSYKQLRAGQKIKGPQAFTKADRKNFTEKLVEILSMSEGI